MSMRLFFFLTRISVSVEVTTTSLHRQGLLNPGEQDLAGVEVTTTSLHRQGLLHPGEQDLAGVEETQDFLLISKRN